jgi:hypothetical protein
MEKREYPLFIIDNSRSHGRGREKDFVACTSRDLPWVGEITILTERELEIDQDWKQKPFNVAFTDDNGAGLRAKLKVLSVPDGFPVGKSDLQSLMRRCLKEWRIRRGTVAVDMEDISNEAVVKFADALLEQTRENLRENPKDSQAYMVGCILTKIKKDYSEKE